jgi:hypothetical protein
MTVSQASFHILFVELNAEEEIPFERRQHFATHRRNNAISERSRVYQGRKTPAHVHRANTTVRIPCKTNAKRFPEIEDRIVQHLVGAGRNIILRIGVVVLEYGTEIADVEYSYISVANTTVNGNNIYVTNTTLDENNVSLANTSVDGNNGYVIPVSKEFNDALQSLSLFLHIVIFIFGLILNVTLIIIFALEEEARTSQNLMIFNITATDIITIIRVFTPFISPSRTTEIIFWIFRFPVHVAELSVICLSAERYLALSRTLQNSSRCRISSHTRNILYIIGVWSAALGVMTIVWVSLSYGDIQTKICVILIDFLILILGVPICVTVFNVLTYRLLKQSAQDIPGEGSQAALVRSRYRSSRVIILMSIAYIVSYMPGFIVLVIYVFKPALKIYLRTSTFLSIYVVSYFLYFCKIIINPIALYIGSEKFRTFFNKYLFRCLYEKEKEQTAVHKVGPSCVNTQL